MLCPVSCDVPIIIWFYWLLYMNFHVNMLIKFKFSIQLIHLILQYLPTSIKFMCLNQSLKFGEKKYFVILSGMVLDLVLRTEQFTILMDETFSNKKILISGIFQIAWVLWNSSNIPGVVPRKVTIAKEFLKETVKCFVKGNNVETSTLLANLSSLK